MFCIDSVDYHAHHACVRSAYDAAFAKLCADKDAICAEASVVLIYIGDDLGARMAPVLQKLLKPGTRVVAHRFTLGDWKPDKSVTVKGADGDDYTLHYWVVKEKK